MVSHIEFLVEEPSMEAFLGAWLDRYLPQDITASVHPHGGKYDLLGKLSDRLRGYARWLPEDWRIVIIVDRDNEDCRTLKDRLEAICTACGLATLRTGQPCRVATCIAIEELEAWYFGDWQAVITAYPRVSPTVPNRRGYRDPDAVLGGTWENFERILMRHGYFPGGLEKIRAAREIGAHVSITQNNSASFRYLVSVLDALMPEGHSSQGAGR